VTTTETVQARLDATGKQQEARVYEQLTFTGKGRAHVSNPVSTTGLRNLDGFGGFTVADGALTTDVTVDGEQRLRTVSDFDRELPLGLSVVYTLDGKVVSPGSALGRSGTLEVRYTVTNKTARHDTASLPLSRERPVGDRPDRDHDAAGPVTGPARRAVRRRAVRRQSVGDSVRIATVNENDPGHNAYRGRTSMPHEREPRPCWAASR
jgi:hypothetical protein